MTFIKLIQTLHIAHKKILLCCLVAYFMVCSSETKFKWLFLIEQFWDNKWRLKIKISAIENVSVKMLINYPINSMVLFRIHCYCQSHYIEVAQGGMSSRAIHNWLWIFSLFQPKMKYFPIFRNIFSTFMLCNFLVRTLQYL